MKLSPLELLTDDHIVLNNIFPFDFKNLVVRKIKNYWKIVLILVFRLKGSAS